MPDAAKTERTRTTWEIAELLTHEAIDVHKVQLEFMASTNYNYSDNPDATNVYSEYEGVYQGLRYAARALQVDLDEPTIQNTARTELIAEHIEEIGKLRRKASGFLDSKVYAEMAEEEKEKHKQIFTAHIDLEEKERILDALLVVEQPFANKISYEIPDTRYRLVDRKTRGQIAEDTFYTEEVANYRKQDLIAGACFPYSVLKNLERTYKNILVERAPDPRASTS